MSFLARMRVSPSNAEIAYRIELQTRGLASKLRFDKVVFLTGPLKGKVFNKENVTYEMVDTGRFTVPDGLSWGLHAFYLDGPVHRRRGVKNRDDRIDELLRCCGFKPVRWSFSPPVSRQRMDEICDETEAFLEEQK